MGQGTIPDDWEGEYCRYAVCWPSSPQWEAVLRGVLTFPARGRFWDEHTGNILEAQQVIRETFDQNLHLEGVIMACNDLELVASFNAIASAIRYAADRDFAKACCELGIGGSGGIVGVVTQPFGGNEIPIYGTQPPATLPEGETFPEGFESVEEWDVHKCAVANVIIDGVLNSLQNLTALNFAQVNGLGVVALAAVSGFLVFPPATIPVLIGALIILVVSQAALLAARDYIIDNRQEWLCWLYEAESVSQVIGTIADGIDLLIAFISVSGPIGNAVKLVLMLLMNGDALNQLFDANADYQYPDADCSDCAPSGDFRQGQANSLTWETWNIEGDFEIGIPVILDSKTWEIPPASDAQAVVLELAYNQITATFEMSSYVPYTIEGCGDFRLGSGTGGGNAGQENVYCNDDTLPPGEWTFGNVTFYSLTPFTLTVTRTG